MNDCAGCTYEDTLLEIKREFPKFALMWKEESRLMRFIAGFLRFISFGKLNTFQTQFITTIGCTVYVPDSWRQESDISKTIILRHERVHMRQKARWSMPLFTFLYLLCPLPGGLAASRTLFELEAYEETLKSTIELYPNGGQLVLKKEYRARMISNFVGPSYFWMWPFRSGIERWYDRSVARLLDAQRKKD